MNTPSILIAGAGYVGIALANRLAAEGHHVNTLRRSAASPTSHITPIQANLITGEGLAQLPRTIETIIYTAAADTITEAAYRDAYIIGLKNILATTTPQRLIFTSSTGVYAQDSGEWVDETSETLPQKFSGTVMLEAEAIALGAPCAATVVRFGGIYGPGRTRLIDQVRTGAAYSLANRVQYLNLIHRDDCAGVLHHLLNLVSPAPIYAAVDNEPMERGSLLRWLAARMGAAEPAVRDIHEAPDPQRGGNRRVSNALLRANGYTFKNPTAREGYGEMIDAEKGTSQ